MANSEQGDAQEIHRGFLPVGTVLHGKYRIDGVIGTGGMAVVYAATHRNRRRFAVKILHPEISTRREIRARFIREGYVANSVDHPGVVSILDDDVTEDGSAFLVMELLEGATVDGFGPRARPLPLRESLAISLDVLDVLAAAHSKSIVHRDIKPANLFITRQGQVKVLDFGIARLRDETLAVKATGTGATLGTPAFMAPEQALALASEIDARTDLWAVGATLFTMLSGALVHPGDNARQVMIRAATEPARSLASVAPDVPAAVVEWVSRALLFDKSARWESAGAMRDAGLRILREQFGAVEEGCAKRLFQLCAADLATSATEMSPTGALRSAVRETTRTTLESSPGALAASPSIPAPPFSAPAQHARSRRGRVAFAAVAAIALGVGLVVVFAQPSRQVAISLSAARTAAEAAPPAGSVMDKLVPTPAPASTNPSAVALSSVSSSRSTVVAKRSLAPVPTRREQPRSEPAASATSSPLPAAGRGPWVAPTRNPLVIEIQ